MNTVAETQMKQIDQVIQCSEAMVSHAEAGKWDDVANAEDQRRALLNKLFANPGCNKGVPEINVLIEKIIDINKTLENLTIKARDKTRMELERIKEGRSAVNSYAQNI